MTAAWTLPSRSLLQRINVRMCAFFLIVAAPFLWFGYVFVNQTLTGGIENHGDYLKVDLKQLGEFTFDSTYGKLTDIPSKWRALDGKRVMLSGFMNNSRASGPQVADFEFVFNRQICCFLGPPLVQERVFAFMPDQKTAPYDINNLMNVVGILHVKPTKNEVGAIEAVYTLDVEKIERV